MPNLSGSKLRERPFPYAGRIPLVGLVFFGLFTGFLNTQADEVDELITTRMQERHITGLSLAIIEDGKIIKARGYGFTDKSARSRVTPETLFQAGSISKSVAALGALHLVQKGRLSLDADVNTELHSWKVPENEFTKDKKVTLRGILCMAAGLTVHGFPGYATNAPIPTLVEVLDGVKPANTPAVRVNIIPGSKFSYSGGGYTLMQQLVIDASEKPFPEFMWDTVLKPLGMTNSTYEQPLPLDRAASAAAGYYASGGEVKGRWHIYPEMAAAGLWTTASDLARFTIGIQRALAGNSNSVISQAMTRQMLLNQYPMISKDDGLGVFVFGSGKTLQFSHGGRNAGFDGFMFAYANVGRGVVILMNANDNKGTINDVVQAIAKKYAWEGFDTNSIP